MTTGPGEYIPAGVPTPEELEASQHAAAILEREEADMAYLAQEAMRTVSPPFSLKEMRERRDEVYQALDSFGWAVVDRDTVPLERLEQELEAAYQADYDMQDAMFPYEDSRDEGPLPEDEDPLAGDVEPTGGYYEEPDWRQTGYDTAHQAYVARQHGDYTG